MGLRYTTTKLTYPQIKRLVRTLPAVLAGRVTDTHGLRRTFLGAFAHELFRLGYDSFRVRASGMSIAGFDPWTPLTKRTISRKSSPSVRSTLYERPDSINIRTGRLLASFAPGTATATGYLPANPDQRVRLRTGSIELESLVRYASRALSGRPVWPANMNPLVRRATERGIEALMQRLSEVAYVR